MLSDGAKKLSGVSIIVHRSTREIGGNCIEVRAGDGHRIILDVGRPLDAPDGMTGLLPRSLDVVSPVDGVLLSHPHQDHWGLLEELPPHWPVYSGSATEKLIRISTALFGKDVQQRFTSWKSGAASRIGPFAVTPLLTDHSAFDAHMLLIEVHGKRILYSGDFRLNGRKAALPRRLMADPPRRLDVLLMEGTNLGSDKVTVTEHDLEQQFVTLFRSTPGRVFVAWSPQNVDRTVTLYRACLKAGRTLVVDLYSADVLETLAAFGKLPRPGWKNLKVAITSSLMRSYHRSGRETFVDAMAKNGISASRLAGRRAQWVIMVRPSLMRDYEAKGVAPDAEDAWCWSMWRGYLKNKSGASVQKRFGSAGSRAAHLHTSGHASTQDLKAFAQAMNAKVLVPIHGVAWDRSAADFPRVRRLKDGEPLVL